MLVPPGQGKAAESGYHSYVKTEVVPPACIESFIYPDRLVEQPDDECEGGDPPVPDPGKEIGLVYWGVRIAAWSAGTQQQQGQ